MKKTTTLLTHKNGLFFISLMGKKVEILGSIIPKEIKKRILKISKKNSNRGLVVNVSPETITVFQMRKMKFSLAEKDLTLVFWHNGAKIQVFIYKDESNDNTLTVGFVRGNSENSVLTEHTYSSKNAVKILNIEGFYDLPKFVLMAAAATFKEKMAKNTTTYKIGELADLNCLFTNGNEQ